LQGYAKTGERKPKQSVRGVQKKGCWGKADAFHDIGARPSVEKWELGWGLVKVRS